MKKGKDQQQDMAFSNGKKDSNSFYTRLNQTKATEDSIDEMNQSHERASGGTGDLSKSFKKDYNIDVELKDNEKPSLILYKYRWIVLLSFFMTSCSTGALSGSLSTNRNIIAKMEDALDRDDINNIKYID
jgi:hypothetical protein